MKHVLALALTSSLSLCSAFAAEGNGGGVNGPKMEGEAIPKILDREIEYSKLEEVEQACKASFAIKIFEQVMGRKDTGLRITITQTYLAMSDSSRFILMNASRGTGKDFLFGKVVNANSVIIRRATDRIGIDLIPEVGEFAIPYFNYTLAEVDSSYGEMGELISARRVVRDLRLVNGNRPPVPLMNAVTKRPVALKFDFRPYQDCLVSGIQK